MDLQTRRQYLGLMGIPLWVPRIRTAEPDGELQQPEPAASSAPPGSRSTGHEARITAAAMPTVAEPPKARPATDSPAGPASTPASAVHADCSHMDCSHMDWTTLQQTVSGCTACGLHRTRTRTVFGTGSQTADWMIIGEAPGAEEDRQGEPFVGRAGSLLDNMLQAIGLDRRQAYIANTLKCRPPNNRDPKPEESASCRAYLERQLALIQPRLILVVGRIAAHNLLQTDVPLGRLRGSLHHVPGSDIPVLVTYHPAYLLRRPAEKRKAWQDLQQAMAFARQHGFDPRPST